jgi:uncharacterized SAM-binding protein YcdF (DUF218 family)
MKASSRRRRALAALLLALLLGGYLGRGALLPAVACFLDVADSPHPVDAVLVLGGGAPDRPFVAAALYRAGLAGRVLVPTVRVSLDGDDGLYPPEHELVRRALRARGVPDDCILLLPGECTSTRDEAQALSRFLDTQPGARVAVVTHGYHTRRARLLFRRALGERMNQVHFVAAPTDRCRADDWWGSEEGWATYLTEYTKVLIYQVR